MNDSKVDVPKFPKLILSAGTRYVAKIDDQKQPPEVLCKIQDSRKFHKIDWKTPVPASLLLKKKLWQEHLFYRTPLDDCFWMIELFVAKT